MARKEITTPLDLKNLDNHNYNYDDLYGLIDETDRRISEDMWEEIKDANTMKMLEPVQTAADLPSEAADKSLITVIDEQRVYGFVNGEWQPFNQIDLDPFEPFKDELAAIVAAYEKQIQNITQEVQSTKDSAIDSINQTQTEAESQISTIRDEMTAQSSDLTALFNDSMNKLTSKQDTALAEVDSAKQAAITALEDFNNTDTSNWQKHKLTNDDGTVKDFERGMDLEDEDFLDSLSTGFHYLPSPINPPVGYSGFLAVFEMSAVKVIYFQPYNQDKLSINRYYQKWSGWKELTGVTREVLFEGSSKGVGSLINLKKRLNEYSSITISGEYPGGRFNETHLLYDGDSLPINRINLRDSDGGVPISYEIILSFEDDLTLMIKRESRNNLFEPDDSSTTETHFTINYIMGWA